MMCKLGLILLLSVSPFLEHLQWEKRVVLIFTPNSEDEEYQEQIEFLRDETVGMKERDITVWQIIADKGIAINGKLQDKDDPQELFHEFRVPEDHFTLILVGKDGRIKLRQDHPMTAQRLFKIIDKSRR